MEPYHILNGDALKDRFPEGITGKVLVAREALVDGDVSGATLRELYATRARFISTAYEGNSETDYYQHTVAEFDRMERIPEGAEVNLWFEDDLFCQVNMWFVVNLLKNTGHSFDVCLVRPETDLQYGFAALDENGLLLAYRNRQKIEADAFEKLAALWPLYQIHDHLGIAEIADQLEGAFPFLPQTVQAYIEALPGADEPGRPVQTLLSIMEELQTDDFATIFREFSKRESIYGLGDLQVKRLLDDIRGLAPQA